MSYTNYPKEALNFSSKAKDVKNKLSNTNTYLGEITNILDSSHTDILSLKTIDINKKISKIVDNSIKAVDGDIQIVKTIAENLENEERQRQEALKLKKEGDDVDESNQ